MRFAAVVLCLFTVFFCVSAFGEDKPAEPKPAEAKAPAKVEPAKDTDLIKLVIAHSADLKGSTVYADLFGKPERGKFVSADDSGITLEIIGQPMPFAWADFGEKRLLDVATKCAKSADDFILLARYVYGKSDIAATDAMLDSAIAADAAREADVKKIRDVVHPPEEAKPVIKAPVMDASGASQRPQYPAVPPASWQCLGPGGGGAIYTPVISPHDPNVAMVTCDMGGVYMTRDGGRHWRVLPQMHLGHAVAFSSTDPNVAYVGLSLKVFRTMDMGVTWQAVTADRQYPTCCGWHVEVDPDNGNFVWVAFGWGGEAGNAVQPSNRFIVEYSKNGGNAFTDGSKGFPTGSGMVKKLAIDRTTPVGSRTVYAATTGGFYKSVDGGASWQKTGTGLPKEDLRQVVTLYDKTAKKTVILVSCEPGGVYRSEDGGQTFVEAMNGMDKNSVIEEMCASWVDGNIAYAGGTKVWKTVDAGKSWTAAYTNSTKYAGWLGVTRPWSSESGRGMGCNPKNPNQVWMTGDMQLMTSDDGGMNWTETNSHPMPEGTPRGVFKGDDAAAQKALYRTAPLNYDGGGLEVTFNYQVIPNPLIPNTFYAGYADIGDWRTEDGGKSWIYNLGYWNDGEWQRWRNSCYEVAIDERRPGRMYAVISGLHNLPGADPTKAGQYNNGGVVVTEDGGKTWSDFKDYGLPDRPCTSVVIDRRSQQDNVLYVAVHGVGVFCSMNGGKKWESMSDGLPSNARAWRLRQAFDNSIYLVCTNNNPGGVWKYDETAKKWNRLDTNPKFTDVRDLIVGGKGHEGFIAIAGAGSEGGVFASLDKGVTWKKLFSGDAHSVECSTDGQYWFAAAWSLYRSNDGGGKWDIVNDFPFSPINDVTLNPKNPGELWVGTAGCGVFKGPGVPVSAP
jgi:photosystem II stability/assembly factor-like uncharacterized protein